MGLIIKTLLLILLIGNVGFSICVYKGLTNWNEVIDCMDSSESIKDCNECCAKDYLLIFRKLDLDACSKRCYYNHVCKQCQESNSCQI